MATALFDSSRRLARVSAVAFLTLFAAGCDLGLDPNDDISGFYDYAGTVHDSPGRSVNGEMDISRQFGSTADVRLDWNFYEGATRTVHIETVGAVPADISSDGRFNFIVEGRLTLSNGSQTNFTLYHEGRRDGSRGLRGTWRLVTDLPSEDTGTFSASR